MCRASLSPWFEKGGINPVDDTDKPVFVGRCNLGAISLHLPMILAKSREENKNFYEVLDYYLELIRNLHKKTYEFLGKKKASTNPIAFMQGGFLNGYLKADDKIKSLLKPMTMSFGITALNELQRLYNGKSIYEDGNFALEVMKYINDKIDVFKKEDDILYAIYGTPGESLCFAGDTLVQTYNGHKKISEITTDDLVYSYNENTKKIELKEVVASQMTTKNAVTVTVKFDNGQEIICTPNHPFAKRVMVKNNKGWIVGETIKYVEAKDLVNGDRIKSNYIIKNIDGHLRCSTDQYIHDINAFYKYGEKPKGCVVHHINKNKIDNSFDNLIYMTGKEHRILHMSEGMIKKQYTSGSQKGRNNSFFGKKHTEESISKIRNAKIGKNNVNSKPVVQLNKNGEVINLFDSMGEAKRKTGFSNISYACNKKYKNKTNTHEYKGYLWYFANELNLDTKNHKVVSVTYNNNLIPVYNIEVKDNHNYYVGGDDGILVHNCGLQAKQFREKYGVIKNVSDKEYMSNSFHCHVTEHITPIEKQDSEKRFWDYFNGGKIQYCRYPIGYNKEAIKTLVKRAMDMGFYEGVNLELAYCEDCGYEQVEMDKCPKCNSEMITKISRMNGLSA